jgi:glutathione synthase
MSVELGVVMDPITGINVKKDSTLAMLRAAARRGLRLWYLEVTDLVVRDGVPFGRMRPLELRDQPDRWHELGEPELRPLAALDIILMRKDPPFDIRYVYATHILELAEAAGVLVANRPQALRDTSEKLALAFFPDAAPPTLVSARHAELKAFLAEFGDIVVKPLDGMGGMSVFRIQRGDGNTNVILETLTGGEQQLVMAQRYLPAITAGDKRVLVIEGEAVPFGLARLPQGGDVRANLAAGGRGEVQPLSETEQAVVARIGPTLLTRGLYFVGLDFIGGYLTEVNVTSPTCIREIEAATGLDIAGRFIDALLARRMAGQHSQPPA